MSILLAGGLLLASPAAAAFGVGVDATSVAQMKAAGASPAYGQTWVGNWMKTSGWGGFEGDLKKLRDSGTIPVIQWYYWGDDISPSCVQHGCAGRTKGDWDAMARELASRANAIMGGRPFYVVLEPEFQKGGIASWEDFDGHLANQAHIIRGAAPSAQIVVGFGHWGGWDIFDRAVAASNLVGFQILFGSTRDSAATAEGSADYMVKLAGDLKARWGKPIMVYDVGIATYGGWEGVQEKAIQNIIAKRGTLDGLGVKAVVWRYVHDNDQSSGYYGPAESSWGVITKSGGKKAGYDDLLALIRGGSAPPASSPAPNTGSPAPSSDVFSEVKGNEYWVQTKVANNPTKVEARVNGGGWNLLENKGWGWAKSFHAPQGSTVEFRATFSNGAAASASFGWVPGSGAAPSPSSPAPVSGNVFSEFSGNDYWVQTKVANNPTKVEARVNGGGWNQLENKGWGWAKSIHAPQGSTVEFRATFSGGNTATASVGWIPGKAGGAPAAGGGGFSASFSGVKVQEWWVQTSVDTGEPLSKVEARVNGGAWTSLENKGWGWAKSIHVPAGSSVEFRAVAHSGATKVSSSYRR